MRLWPSALALLLLASCATKPADDWTATIDDLLPAIDACLRDHKDEGALVLKAWPTDRVMAQVRLRDPDGSRHDCIAEGAQARVESMTPVPAAEAALPGEGQPVFMRGERPQPAGACYRWQALKSYDGREIGAVSYAKCAG